MDRERLRPEVVVWSFSKADRYASQIHALDVPVHGFPETLSTTDKMRRLRRLVLEIKPQVLHSYIFYLNFAAHYATYGTNTVAIGSIRCDFVSEKKEAGLLKGNLSARWPRNQICNSFSAMQSAEKSKGPFTPERLFVVRNGLDMEEVRWTPIPSEKRVSVVGVGSLVPRKRWDRLLHAVLMLKQRGLDFFLTIVGDGPLRKVLIERAETLGLTGCVEFIGARDDVPTILAESTCLVHTSDAEGCPNVVMESMAAGRPVVMTDAGDAPYLVEDGKTGFVVRRGDSKTLVECLAILIADPSLCQCMGKAGRAKALREFGLDRLVNETLIVYEAVGGGCMERSIITFPRRIQVQ
jgi:glycosyltransferase involved in cell wall biosynthesis